MDIEKERRAATETLDLFRARLNDADDSFFPIRVALKWSQALDQRPPDPQALRDIARTAGLRRDEFEIAFFAFCNEMDAVCREI